MPSNVILDCDGVLMDTNRLKARNILSAVSGIADEKKTAEFINYFTQHSGVPREVKIERFYSPEQSRRILKIYNSLNANTLAHAPLTAGLRSFLTSLHSLGTDAYVISGGDEQELIEVLDKQQILAEFRAVKGGPKTKVENYWELHLQGPTMMIGDSLTDYRLARQFNLEFVFMYGYTQFKGWREFFRDINDITFIENLRDFMKSNRWTAMKSC